MNRVWYTVDKDGRAIVHTSKPVRTVRDWDSPVWIEAIELLGEIPAFLSDITWKNEPVEIEIYINRLN